MFNLALIKSLTKNPLDVYKTAQAGYGGGAKWQMAFHKDTSKLRFLIAANQVGKSYCMSAELLFCALGHPYRGDVPTPSTGMVLCADLGSGWAVVSGKIRELMPADVLADGCTYDPVRGYRYMGTQHILFANGSSVIAKGSEQPLTALAGYTLDYLMVDEPPKSTHWSEARARVSVRNGPVFVGLTPVGRPVDFMRDAVEGNIEEGRAATESGWSLHRVALSYEAVPHRTRASVDAQIAATMPYDRPQRIEAQWEGIVDGQWIAFNSEEHTIDYLPDAIETVAIGIDWGELSGSTVYSIIGIEKNGRCILMHELIIDARDTTMAQEAQMLTDALDEMGIALQDVERCVGDSNSSGRLGMGFSVNDLLQEELRIINATPHCPFDIEVPRKGRGSVKARWRNLSQGFSMGKLVVYKGCTQTIRDLSYFSGNHADSHSLDAVSYVYGLYSGRQVSGLNLLVL